MLIGFEWDVNKAKANLAGHGVCFEEACTVFDDLLSITIGDPDHSFDERREVTIGKSKKGNLLIVNHCDRGPDIRIISSRPATASERKQYESGI